MHRKLRAGGQGTALRLRRRTLCCAHGRAVRESRGGPPVPGRFLAGVGGGGHAGTPGRAACRRVGGRTAEWEPRVAPNGSPGWHIVLSPSPDGAKTMCHPDHDDEGAWRVRRFSKSGKSCRVAVLRLQGMQTSMETSIAISRMGTLQTTLHTLQDPAGTLQLDPETEGGGSTGTRCR